MSKDKNIKEAQTKHDGYTLCAGEKERLLKNFLEEHFDFDEFKKVGFYDKTMKKQKNIEGYFSLKMQITMKLATHLLKRLFKNGKKTSLFLTNLPFYNETRIRKTNRSPTQRVWGFDLRNGTKRNTPKPAGYD